MTGKITIKEIAAKSNTSTKTVSKALNDKPGVSEELRKKIKRIASKNNYIPNIFGRGLGGVSMKCLGVIIADNENAAWARIVKGIEEAAAEKGYNIFLCNSKENLETESKLIKMLIEKQVDGILWSPAYDVKMRDDFKVMKDRGVPYILLNRYIQTQKKNCVATDNVIGAYMGVKYLLEKGHRDIIYLTSRDNTSVVEARLAGFKKALGEYGLSYNVKNVYRRASIRIESGYEETKKILQDRRDFSAIVSFNDTIAFGIIKALREAGVAIPDEIAVLGFDDIRFSEICQVPLTTVHQSFYTLGRISFARLYNVMSKDDKVPVEEIPQPFVVIRESA